MSVLLLSSCGSNSNKDSGDKVLEVQMFTTPMKIGKVLVDPVHGEEKEFWYGAISGVEGFKANGVSFMRRFDDGYFVSIVNLNIAKLEKDAYHYWLSAPGSTEKRYMGVLQNLVGDVRHAKVIETKDDLSKLTHVIVTKESVSKPKTSGTVVAEGDLKKVDK